MPIAGRAPTAASSISLPPRACTSTSETPSWPALLTAPATVFGMSWNLRSRKTFSPARDHLAHEVGTGGGEDLAADLEHPDVAGQPVHHGPRRHGVLHVESDDETVARASILPAPPPRAGPDSAACPPRD
jgi:hypothetical protein